MNIKFNFGVNVTFDCTEEFEDTKGVIIIRKLKNGKPTQ